MHHTRFKRDFGITATLVSGVLLTLSGGATAVVSLNQTTLTAQGHKEALEASSRVFETQRLLNDHFPFSFFVFCKSSVFIISQFMIHLTL